MSSYCNNNHEYENYALKLKKFFLTLYKKKKKKQKERKKERKKER